MLQVRRYLWCEKEVFKGDRGAILRLLEDLHKHHDGVQTTPAVSGTVRPYLGRSSSLLEGRREDIGWELEQKQGTRGMQAREEGTTKQHRKGIQNRTLDLPLDIPLAGPERVPIIKEPAFGNTLSSSTIEDHKFNVSQKAVPDPLKTSQFAASKPPLPNPSMEQPLAPANLPPTV